MINAVTGEIEFNEFWLKPHRDCADIDFADGTEIDEELPCEGYYSIYPPNVTSEFGTFEVDLTFDIEARLVLVALCHQNDFYEAGTPKDAERRTFHEAIVTRDLGGQMEYAWGEVKHWLCAEKNRAYLVVLYTPGTDVPVDGPIGPFSLVGRNNPDSKKQVFTG